MGTSILTPILPTASLPTPSLPTAGLNTLVVVPGMVLVKTAVVPVLVTRVFIAVVQTLGTPVIVLPMLSTLRYALSTIDCVLHRLDFSRR